MSWLVFAFSGPVLWAISTHLDKYLVEKYFKHSDVAVLLLFTAFIGVLLLPFIAFYEPAVIQPAPAASRSSSLSGILYMGAMLFYLRALQSEEASVVSPFFQAVPLFGYVLAYFSRRTLSVPQMTGGVLIIAGTLIVSVRFGRNVRGFKLRLALLDARLRIGAGARRPDLQVFRDPGRILDDHILAVRRPSDFRLRAADVRLLPAATARRIAGERGRFPRRRRIERTHQSRRRAGHSATR